MELVDAYAVAAARAGDLITATGKDQLVDLPASAPTLDRLVALSGRTP